MNFQFAKLPVDGTVYLQSSMRIVGFVGSHVNQTLKVTLEICPRRKHKERQYNKTANNSQLFKEKHLFTGLIDINLCLSCVTCFLDATTSFVYKSF